MVYACDLPNNAGYTFGSSPLTVNRLMHSRTEEVYESKR